MKRLLLAALVATAGVGAAQAEIPSSVAQALRDLHRNVALAARWANFAEGSSVRARVHSVSAETGDASYVRIEELTSRNDKQLVTTYWDADHKQEQGRMRYSVDVPEFAEAKAVKVGDDSIPVANKMFAAQIYRFEITHNILGERRTIQWRFWLGAGVPEGELRRVTVEDSSDPTRGDVDTVSLVGLKTPLLVGNKTLECHCRDSEDKYVDGTVERYHVCYHDSVPGGIVKKDVRKLKDGKEILRQDYTLLEFHAVKR